MRGLAIATSAAVRVPAGGRSRVLAHDRLRPLDQGAAGLADAAGGAPGTYLSFGKYTHRGWMGAGYLVARRLDPDGESSHLVGRFGDP